MSARTVNVAPSEDRGGRIVRLDQAFASLVAAVGEPPRRRALPVAQRFPALLTAVTSQLLAVKAADTIHARVVARLAGDPSPDAVLRVGAPELRACGLSNAKAQTMVALAESVRDGTLTLATHGRLSDAEIVHQLTRVRGIGPWSAHMYLMFTMGRPDVWPTGDYGVRSGWSILHGLPESISERSLRDEGDRFVGLRSSVAWYCWQALHRARAD